MQQSRAGCSGVKGEDVLHIKMALRIVDLPIKILLVFSTPHLRLVVLYGMQP